MDPSQQIDKRIEELADWRGGLYAALRKLINDAEPSLTEAWKWDTAVWQLNDKNILALGAFKDHVKINFFMGALLDDTDNLFNSGLESKQNRSINFAESSELPTEKLRALIRQAVAKQIK